MLEHTTPATSSDDPAREIDAMKILVADDHALYRDGLRQIAQRLGEGAIVLEASDWASALEVIDAHPDIALAMVDLNMPGKESFAGLAAVIDHAETIPVVVVSASGSPVDMKRTLDAGAMGYISKSETTAVMYNALQLVLSGGIYVPPGMIQPAAAGRRQGDSALPFGLTPKQYEVLKELIEGKSNKEIARALDLSPVTVKAHVGAIFKSLQVTNRAQAIRASQESGMRTAAHC